MPMIETVVETKTIKCDGPKCTKKEISFIKAKTQQEAEALKASVIDNPENAWLRTSRTVITGDGRQLLYCGDICEVDGIETGTHDAIIPPVVAPTGNEAMIQQLAAAQQQKAQTDAALRTGAGAKIKLTDN